MMRRKNNEIVIPKIEQCPHCGCEVKPGKTYCPNCYFTLPGCEEYEAQKVAIASKRSKKGVFRLFYRSKPPALEEDLSVFQDLKDANEDEVQESSVSDVPNFGTGNEDINQTKPEKNETATEAEKLELTKEEVASLARKVGLDVSEVDEKENERFAEQIAEYQSAFRDFEDARREPSATEGTADGDRAVQNREIAALIRNSRAEIASYRTTERAAEKERNNRITEQAAIEFSERERINEKLASSTQQISSLQDELSEMKKIALFDELTGLKNRHAFDVDSPKFQIKNLVIISIDVNNLKPTNDNYGHTYGDLLLTTVASSLKDVYGENCYRMGGDEFLVVLEGIGKRVLKKRREELDFKLKIAEESFDVDMKISIASGEAYGDGIKTLKQLLNEADANMYRDKHMMKLKPELLDSDLTADIKDLNSELNDDIKEVKSELPAGADFDITQLEVSATKPKEEVLIEDIEYEAQLQRFIIFFAKKLISTAVLIGLVIFLS